ncbi:MAG: histidine phosphatase family protein [Clostridiales bacterium]|nr:histidine phosphatase family protein [Clostridiales bacterium]
MEILLIRHGKTGGNQEGRYIGRTDEPLLETSRESLLLSPYRDFDPDVIYVSPMRRCRETAAVLFPDYRADAEPQKTPADCASAAPRRSPKLIVCDDLREMDFGLFENKNYKELKEEPAYREWLDGGGRSAFPGGEDGATFRIRCRKAFEDCLEDARHKGVRRIAFVVHGGTIMSIMEAYGTPKSDFYRWQVKNGEGVFLSIP